jgi:hypothetical protein
LNRVFMRGQDDSPLCESCQVAVTFLKANLKDNEDIDQADLELVCGYLGQYATDCKTLIDDNFDTLVQLIEEDVDPKVFCSEVQLCAANGRQVKVVDESSTCTECKAVIVTLKEELKTNEKIEKEDLEALCDKCPSKADCVKFIDDNFDQLVALIESDVKADEVCQILMLCSGTVQRFSPVRDDSPTCEACKELVTYLKDELKTNEKLEIEDLKALCDELPADIDRCKDFVDDHFDEIIELLEKDLDPEETCEEIQFCAASAAPRVHDSELCTECKSAVNEIKEELKTNEKIELEDLEALCDKCPSKADCVKFIDDNFDELISLIEANVEADEVCEALELCSSSRSSLPLRQLHSLVTGGDFCMECKSNINIALDELKAEVEDIEAFLTEICDVLGENKQQCIDFVDKYTEEVIAMIEADVDPASVCAAIGLCNARLSAVMPGPVLLSRPRRSIENAMSYGMMLLQRIHQAARQHACFACKVIADNAKNNGMITSGEELGQFSSQVQQMICNDAQGACLDTVSVDSIMALSEENPDMDCPIQGICDLDSMVSPVELINNAMCDMFTKLFAQLNDDDTWEELQAQIVGILGENGVEEKMVMNAIEQAKSFQANTPAPDYDYDTTWYPNWGWTEVPYVDELPKMALIHELMKEHVIGYDCDITGATTSSPW